MPLLRDNRGTAEWHLVSLDRTLSGDPGLRERYDDTIQEMEDLGMIHDVTSGDED